MVKVDHMGHGQGSSSGASGPTADGLAQQVACSLRDRLQWVDQREESMQVEPAVEGRQQRPAQEFHVYLNKDRTWLGADDFECFADKLSTWAADFKSCMDTKRKDLRDFLRMQNTTPSALQVVGFNEFPHTRGRSLQGSERLIERQYWLKGTPPEGGSGNLYLILHVRYEGKWGSEDRSVVAEVSWQHTSEVETRDRQRKCHAVSQWKERYAKTIPDIPRDGWRWKSDASISPLIQEILQKAEEETEMVKSFDAQMSDPTSGCMRKALIIANAEYRHGDLDDLPNTTYDG
eukprot:763464-Hanusia_phi.AAC.2